MRKLRHQIVPLAILVGLVLMACSPTSSYQPYYNPPPDVPYNPGGNTGGNTGGTYTSDSYFWGKWTRMDTGDTWYIADKKVEVSSGDSGYPNGTYLINDGTAGTAPSIKLGSEYGYDASAAYSIVKQSENVAELTMGSSKSLLYRSTGADLSVSGKVVGFVGSRALGVSGMGNLKVVIKNVRNGANASSTTSKGDGTFTVDKVVAGDTIEIKVTPDPTPSVPAPIPVTVYATPDYGQTDIGTIVVADPESFNLKTTFTVGDNAPYVYAGRQPVPLAITFTNTGKADCTAATYAVEAPAGVTISSTGNNTKLTDILGTIEGTGSSALSWDAVKSRSLSLLIACEPFAEEYQDKDIKITISDLLHNKSWEDHVVIRFYRSAERLVINAKDSVLNGFIISPENRSFRFSVNPGDYSYSYVDIPYTSEGTYSLVFSGASAANETLYSFKLANAIDSATAPSDWASQTSDTAKLISLMNRYTTNVSEPTAFLLADPFADHYAYIYKNKVDYFKFTMNSGVPVILQATVPQTVSFAYTGGSASLRPDAQMTVQGSISSPAGASPTAWEWYLDGTLIPGASSASVTLGASAYAVAQGNHRLVPIAYIGGLPYSGEPGFAFTVASAGQHVDNVVGYGYHSDNYPSPYGYNTTQFTISRPGASWIKLRFSAFATGSGDLVKISDAGNTTLLTYSGTKAPFTTEAIVGNSVTVTFNPNTGGTYAGWMIDSVEWMQP